MRTSFVVLPALAFAAKSVATASAQCRMAMPNGASPQLVRNYMLDHAGGSGSQGYCLKLIAIKGRC